MIFIVGERKLKTPPRPTSCNSKKTCDSELLFNLFFFNTSYLQNKLPSTPQRAISNAETFAARRSNVLPSCPIHGLRSELLREIAAKKGPREVPFLTALCADTTLQNRCTCGPQQQQQQQRHVTDDPMKRFSYSPANASGATTRTGGGGDLGAVMGAASNEPGTMTRPMSWHSEHFSLDQVYQQQASQQPPQLAIYNPHAHHNQQHLQHTSVSQQQGSTVTTGNGLLHQHHLSQTSHQYHYSSGMLLPPPHTHQPHQGYYNKFTLMHKSMDSLDIGTDYPTMVTHQHHQNGGVPSQLNTGLSSARSLDNLLQMPPQHYCNLGLAS